MPQVARAFLEDLMDLATAEGGFGHADKLWAEWQKLGAATKAVLFPSAGHVKNLNEFFLLAKRIGENPNPSGTARVLNATKVLSAPVMNGLARLLYTPDTARQATTALRSGRLDAVFSTAGGVLTGFTLKDYHQGTEENSPPIDLLNEGSEGKGKALLLTLGNEAHDRGAVYAAQSTSEEIVFTWNSGELEVRKTYRIRADNPHLIDLAVDVVNKGGADLSLDPRLWIARQQKNVKKEGHNSANFSAGTRILPLLRWEFLFSRPDCPDKSGTQPIGTPRYSAREIGRVL